jgi:hypothetical protein
MLQTAAIAFAGVLLVHCGDAAAVKVCFSIVAVLCQV